VRELIQRFPDPVELRAAVAELRYYPGWRVELGADDENRGQGCIGLTLSVYPDHPDSYHPERHVRTRFLFDVPAAAFNRESWEEWLFAKLDEVDKHERAEWFRFVSNVIAVDDACASCDCTAGDHDGRHSTCACGLIEHRYEAAQERYRRPFKPAHADGWNPGVVRTVVSETVANTPNAGRLIRIACGCGHTHNALMGEHFTVERIRVCDGDGCTCPLNG
jgi:hypothetical protein